MRRQLNVRLLIVALIAGVIAAAADLALYYFLVDVMSARILIPVLVAVFAVILCGAITVYMLIFKESDDDIWFLNGRGMLCIALAICLLVTFFATMLMEWIYDSDVVANRGTSSYIFLQDESGSMDWNDPSLRRYQAIETLMGSGHSNAPYAVYAFDDHCELIRPMGNASQGALQRPTGEWGGGTYLKNAFDVVLADIQSGKLQVGNAPHLIVLTDGEEIHDMDNTLPIDLQTRMKKLGIRVSTIGLAQVDEALLRNIASSTGGSFVMVSDAAELQQGFSTVAMTNKQQNLLSQRLGGTLDAILRILFLVLIGALIGCMKGIACGDEFLLNLLITTGGALIGAVVMEVGLALGLPVLVAQAIYWLLMCVIIHHTKEKIHQISKGDEQMRNSLLTHGSGSPSRSSVQWP